MEFNDHSFKQIFPVKGCLQIYGLLLKGSYYVVSTTLIDPNLCFLFLSLQRFLTPTDLSKNRCPSSHVRFLVCYGILTIICTPKGEFEAVIVWFDFVRFVPPNEGSRSIFSKHNPSPFWSFLLISCQNERVENQSTLPKLFPLASPNRSGAATHSGDGELCRSAPPLISLPGMPWPLLSLCASDGSGGSRERGPVADGNGDQWQQGMRSGRGLLLSLSLPPVLVRRCSTKSR